MLFRSNVTVRGSARPQDGLSGTEVILKMERQMRDSRIFDKVQKKWDAPDSKGSVPFTLSAAVTRALVQRGVFTTHGDFYASTVVARLGHAADGIVRAGCFSFGGQASAPAPATPAPETRAVAGRRPCPAGPCAGLRCLRHRGRSPAGN